MLDILGKEALSCPFFNQHCHCLNNFHVHSYLFCWNLFSFVFISWNLLCNLCDFFYNLLFSLGLAPMSVPSFPLTCSPCIFFIFGREHSAVTFSSLLFFYLSSLLGNKVVWNLLCYFCSKPYPHMALLIAPMYVTWFPLTCSLCRIFTFARESHVATFSSIFFFLSY